MIVSLLTWSVTLVALLAIIIFDLIIVDRRPHEFTPRDATKWIVVYILLAMAFAGFVWVEYGAGYAGQFLAGYLTEYSLSVDNLFVFLVIMTSFAVPTALQHRVLLVGIVIALALRGILIVIGAEIINRFQGVFFLFAVFLFFTAWKVWSGQEEEPDPESNRMVRFIGSRVPTTADYDGTHLITRVDGKRFLTPLAMVMLAIGTTDLLFALDSIPAVFGITSEAYLVFAANAFALMGLRQLYFLIRDLITKLRHLNKGIALILVFIGVKLLLEACHSVLGWDVPLVPVWLSLVVIVVILVVTTLVSLRPHTHES
ncbi:MAG: inner membrane protein alx [Actinomycetota bacterium]|jgi:tellurite resistance protein TerC